MKKSTAQIIRDELKNVIPEIVHQTKLTIKDDLKDLRDQIADDIDGKLKIQKREILKEMDTKLSNQKDEIVKDVSEYVADTIVPMLEERDKQIAQVKKKVGLSPLVD